MNVYKDLEDSIYNVLEGLFPLARIVFAYTNAPEQQTPYIAVDVRKAMPTGAGYNSTLGTLTDTDDISTVTVQDFEAKVRIDVIGKQDDATEASEIAQQLLIKMRTAFGYELLERNRLAVWRTPDTRRVPIKRDTDTYMLYQTDYCFGYTTYTVDETPDYIATVGLDGIYTDAGREPDHTIRTHTDVTQPRS